MRLKELAQGEAWMAADECAFARLLVRRLADQFKARGISETPLLALRVNDLVVSLLLARRIEAQLTPAVEVPDSGKGAPLSVAALAEAVGKARERMRKAMKELEESCAKLGTPLDRGIADAVRPLMLHARGVEEEALETEEVGEDAFGDDED